MVKRPFHHDCWISKKLDFYERWSHSEPLEEAFQRLRHSVPRRPTIFGEPALLIAFLNSIYTYIVRPCHSDLGFHVLHCSDLNIQARPQLFVIRSSWFFFNNRDLFVHFALKHIILLCLIEEIITKKQMKSFWKLNNHKHSSTATVLKSNNS